MADYHIKAHSECNAADLQPTKKTLQITYRPGDTCTHGVIFEESGFRHLHPDLITESKNFDKVTLVHPTTGKRRVLKDNGQSVEPFYEN